MEPKNILVVIEFQYNTKKNKNVPPDIRRAFLGLEKGSPNIPKKIREKINSQDNVICPIHFSLIKKPIRIEISPGSYKLRNPAVGAMIFYEYRGVLENLDEFLNDFNEFLKEIFKPGRYNYSSSCSKFDIFVCNKFAESVN